MAKQTLNFFRVSEWPGSPIVGGVYFNHTAQMIRVATASSGDNKWEDYGGNVTDASFNNNVLTISRATGGNVVLDFSDVPSAEGVNSLLSGLRTDVNNLQTATGIADGATAPSWDTSKSTELKATATLKAGVEAVDARVTAEAAARDASIKALDVSNNISDINHGISVRVDEVDGKVSKPIVDVSTGTVTENESKLVTGNDVYQALKTVVEGLDSSANQSAGTDGLALHAKLEDGKITELNGSIAAETYAPWSTKAVADSAIQGVKVNNSLLTKDASNNVNVTIVTGDSSGNIKVNGTDVAVKGLQSAAYVTEQSLKDYAAGVAKDASTQAEAYANVIKVNNVAQDASQNITIGGADVKLTNYVKGSSKAAVAATDTVNAAIGKLENQIEDAVAGGLQGVDAGAGINVSAVASNRQTISVNVKSGDKILDASTAGLSATLSFKYVSADHKIYLYGSAEDAAHKIGEVDCSDFVKDGMLAGHAIAKATAASQEITFSSGRKHTFTDLVVGKTYIFFEFSDGAITPTYSYEKLDATTLVDVYTAGNGLQLGTGTKDHEFSIKLASGNGYLSVDANGLKVDDASIAAMAQAKADKAVFDASTYTDGKIAALDHTSTGAIGSYIQKVSEADGVVSETVVAFDTSINADSSVNAPTAKAVKDYVDNAFTWGSWE